MLASCTDCKKEISDKATACPHCGHPQQAGLLKDVKALRSFYTQVVSISWISIVGGLVTIGMGLYLNGVVSVISKGITEREATLVNIVVTLIFLGGGSSIALGLLECVTCLTLKPALNRVIKAAYPSDTK